MKPRDACEWWTKERTRVFAFALAERLTSKAPATVAIMHCSWCAKSRDARRRCTCTPVTLVFGATS